jgi:DNA-directed RNA polymerase specialized sigma24 family protein
MTLSRRIILVLNEIADLDVEQIALMIERPPFEVQHELSNAKRALAAGVQGNGDIR